MTLFQYFYYRYMTEYYISVPRPLLSG